MPNFSKRPTPPKPPKIMPTVLLSPRTTQKLPEDDEENSGTSQQEPSQTTDDGGGASVSKESSVMVSAVPSPKKSTDALQPISSERDGFLKRTQKSVTPNSSPRRSIFVPRERSELPYARGVNFHYEHRHSPVTAWHKSISNLVNERLSQEMLFYRRGSYMSEASILQAIMSSDWSRGNLATPNPSEDTEEEVERRCHPPACLYYPHFVLVVIHRWLRKHPKVLRLLAFLLWLTFVAYSLVYHFYIMKFDFNVCNGGGFIAWTSTVILGYIVLFKLILPHIHHVKNLKDASCLRSLKCFEKAWEYTFFRLVVFALLAIGLIVITNHGRVTLSTSQCISVAGYFTIILLAYLCSVEPKQINWKAVIKNLAFQIAIVSISMPWKFGRVLLRCVAEKASVFFSFSQEAAEVVFSDKLPQTLAIDLLSTLTLTGCYMHILYYNGILQRFLNKLGFLLEFFTDATSIEAICAALCPILGGIETSVVLEPYIVLLTRSELHAFVTSGFATMTGVMLALYLSRGIGDVELMTANFATFNGVLAVSKIVYPETDKSITTYRDTKFHDRDEYNLVDSAVRGSISVIKVLVNVIASLIAMVAVVNMFNALVGWTLENVGVHDMDIVGILSVVLRPLIFLMGVEWKNTPFVTRLFVIKTVKNEYFAYTALIKRLEKDPMPEREEALTTALLYGFTNFAHVGVTAAFLTALAPERRRDITETAPRAMLTGVLVNLLTTAVIGAVLPPQTDVTNVQVANTTESIPYADEFQALRAFAIMNIPHH